MIDFNKKFRLYTDASNYAIGAILCQYDDSEEYVVYYLSRVLKGPEINYSVTEKEALAVVWSVRYLRVYLIDRHFEIVTDHSALKWLMTIREPTGRLMRWSLYLQQYSFDISHRAGKSHTNADTLSRPFSKDSNKSSENNSSSVALTRHILVTTRANIKDQNTKILDRLIDIYNEKNLMNFLKHKKHLKNATKETKDKTAKLLPYFEYKNNHVIFQRDLNKEEFLVIPKEHERLNLIKNSS